MDDLLEARRKSHEVRSSTMHDVVINNNGTMVGEALDETNTQLDIDAAMANMMGGMTAPEPVDSSLFNLTGADVADAAKAGVRAVLGGVQDAVTGVVGLASDIGSYLDENVGSLGYVRMGQNGFEYTRELPPGEDVMRLDDAFQAGLKNLGIDVPQGDSSAEAIARGLIQFGAGMAAAPVRGASYLSMMARGGFADALFDPEAGNLSTLLREYGLDNAVLEYLDSKVDEDADAAARLEARFKQSLEGAGLGIPIDMVITGFRLAKSNDGLRETIRNKLTTVKDRLTQPGEMPTVGMNAGQMFIKPEPVKIDTDEAVNVLNLRAEQMKLAPKDRVQPSGQVMFETTPEAYARTFPEQKETPVPRAPEGKALPLGDRARKVIEMSDVISDKLAERAKPFVGTNVQFFYNTGPIVDKAIELGYSKEQAFEALRKFALNYAATSPRTKTEENLRSASLASVKQDRGIDIGTIIGPGGEGINEKGYPMIINPGGLHRKLLDDVMASGISFDTNPKPATFAENVAGNLSGVTVDTHAIRAVLDALNELEPGSVPLKFIGGKTAAKTKEYQAMYQKDPSTFDAATMVADTLGSQKIDGKDVQTEYAVFSDIYKQVAEKLGVKPAEAQSLSWFANGDKTGLASEPKTIVELIDDRVDVTSQLTGMSKDEVFKKFFRGSIPLLSVGGGITLLETGSSMSDDKKQEGM